MPHHRTRKLKIAALWLLIFLAGVLAGSCSYSTRRTAMLEQLISDARLATVAIEAADLPQLRGTRDDLSSPVYLKLKQKLQRLQVVNAQVRFVYLFRAAPDHGVIFLGDSEKAGAKDESLPGDVYPEAKGSPGLQDILRTGEPATEGPLKDEFGTWITAYALVPVPPVQGRVSPRHILGVDVDAAGWNRALLIAALQGAGYVWLLLGLPMAAWLMMERQGEQREVIRNLSEAMEQSHSAIMIVDLESRIEYANRGLCQQIGYGRRELIGRKWRDFQVAQTSVDILNELVATVRAGRIWEGEWFNQRKDGTTYPVRGVVTPVRRRDGELACFVAVLDDVTEVKRKEEELREARDQAESGDRAKGQFLATMSHEVRTPLNGIVGFTSLLLETPLSPEQREYVLTIKMSTEALIQLTGDILDFARIESGKLKLEAMACDPRDCIEDALDLLAAKATEKQVELLQTIGEDVPSAVMVDGGRLRQVLVNLVGNAVKFTERGDVSVSVTVEPEAAIAVESPAPGAGAGAAEAATTAVAANAATEAGDSGAPSNRLCTLVFTVQDTGIGIAPEHQTRLFKPFSQVDESTTRRYGGTGLGLAICRNLVQLMGGEIDLVSEPGKGSRFSFTIRALAAAPQPPVRDLAGLSVGLALRPGKFRAQTTQLLESWRARPTVVETPEDLAGVPCDIAIVEVQEDFARELAARGDPLEGVTPAKTVALVPMNLPNDLRSALRAHFRLLVNKPLHHAAFFALLSGSRVEAQAAGTVTQFGYRVLVVEDNPVNQRLMQRVLKSLGCSWHVLENGSRALEELTARADQYDLVLLDLHMPEMDGMTALAEIRAGKAGLRAQTMWIIALTADAREEQRTRALASGLNDYLTKPIKLDEVETALRRFRTERGMRKS